MTAAIVGQLLSTLNTGVSGPNSVQSGPIGEQIVVQGLGIIEKPSSAGGLCGSREWIRTSNRPINRPIFGPSAVGAVDAAVRHARIAEDRAV